MEPKRFYRSTTDKRIAGVAGGLAEYFAIDPLLVRLVFVILVLAGGGGLLLYIILWIITPERPVILNQTQNSSTMENQQSTYSEPKSPDDSPGKQAPQPRNRGNLIGGGLLINSFGRRQS